MELDEVVQGVLDHVVFQNPQTGWAVARLNVQGHTEPVTAVGHLLGVQPGDEVRLSGRWVTDPRWGRQFHAEGVTRLEPATTQGLERYLGSGLVHGMGPTMAARLVARFGLETLDVIEHHPERLVEVSGIGPVRAARLRAAWTEQRGLRDIMVFLQGHGISPALAARIHRRYGTLAVTTVRQEPYRLAEEVPGIGFRRADRIAAELGIPREAPARLRAGLIHVLTTQAEEGHVFCPLPTLVGAASEVLAEADAPLALGDAALEREVEALVREGRLEREEAGGQVRVLLPELAGAERQVARDLTRLLRGSTRPLVPDPQQAVARFGEAGGLRLAPAQEEAVRAALRDPVLVVTGGPGTGKTTLVRAVVRLLRGTGRRLALCAPTGRAAQRLGEATGQEARTIHRLLEWDPRGGGFGRNREHPLEADLVVADEASMIDVVLMRDLLAAVPPQAHLVLVGDVDQLPSVGPGNVLGDIIRSGAVPVARLDQVFRQAGESRIVMNAHRIQRGESPVLEGGREDFFWIRREDPGEILEQVKSLVAERIPHHLGLAGPEEVQVLTPMRRGELGANNLNLELQALLNPHGASVQRHPGGLRVGDRVMQVSNDYARDVFNGDVGRLEAADQEEGTVTVRFGDRDVRYDVRDLDSLALAYATSVHKAQGSEYPAVVLPLHTQHYVMLYRRLLYTAVTRGRRMVVLVGSGRALRLALEERGVQPRCTALAERLHAEASGSPA